MELMLQYHLIKYYPDHIHTLKKNCITKVYCSHRKNFKRINIGLYLIRTWIMHETILIVVTIILEFLHRLCSKTVLIIATIILESPHFWIFQ